MRRATGQDRVGTMLVASTGGHLKQLHLLRGRFDRASQPHRWVTFDRPQSRSLLLDQGESVDFVPFIGSRDPINAIRGVVSARRVLRRAPPRTIVSTGSAIALPYMVIGRLHGIQCIYVESAARSEGPSLTGRMVSRIPGVQLRTQYAAWADERWRFAGSVFDSFLVEEAPTSDIRKVVVTLGTLEYDFSRLVERLAKVLPPEIDVYWQLGRTRVEGLRGRTVDYVPAQELAAEIETADVVVSHAGVGSALATLETGVCPVLAPRRMRHAEHIDDHQEQIAAELSRRKLCVATEADALTWDDLVLAHSRRVGRAGTSTTGGSRIFDVTTPHEG